MTDRRTGGRGHRDDGPARSPSDSARRRFLGSDEYRADREWQRYEGTAQRDLFRELRSRFLERHATGTRWVLDAGSGPGRFTGRVGTLGARRVAFDLSREMLARGARAVAESSDPVPGGIDWVQGDVLHPPFKDGAFDEVALLGNVAGFAGEESERVLTSAESLLAPGGTLIVEVAPGPGERSSYLARLPAGSVGRLLAAPPRAVLPRIDREGFAIEPERHDSREFRRFRVGELLHRWEGMGWEVRESVAIAPALGPRTETVTRIAADPRSWRHLLEIEETIGRRSERWTHAAAVLIAVRSAARADTIKRRPSPWLSRPSDAPRSHGGSEAGSGRSQRRDRRPDRGP